MNSIASLFLIASAIALLVIPRRWASLPLMSCACYMTLGQGFDIGPFSFPVLRLLIIIGFIRILVRNERPSGGMKGLDYAIFIWGAWALTSSLFHQPTVDAFILRAGFVYNALGIYFLIRAFCQSTEDIILLVKLTGFLLVPVALEMLNEQLTGRNLFSILGGVPELVVVREGRLRAQGPFAHSILAGTVGSVCAPLMIGIWKSHPRAAKIGLAACLGMVLGSSSSGPIMSTLAGGFALLLWRWKHLTRRMRIAAISMYILLDLVMKAPAYYLLARIDLTGGSTGWHRARLIESALEHLDEWWFAGTDYTRHWMPSGVTWNPDHTDITNHYLKMGVWGGLPLMILFMLSMWLAFRHIGRVLDIALSADQFFIWSIGAALFSHAVTCISVSYFDQSFLFLYTCLGIVGSLDLRFRVQ